MVCGRSSGHSSQFSGMYMKCWTCRSSDQRTGAGLLDVEEVTWPHPTAVCMSLRENSSHIDDFRV